MGGILEHRAETIEMVCGDLENEDRQKAADLVGSRYPFEPPVDRRKAFTKFVDVDLLRHPGRIAVGRGKRGSWS